MPKILIVGGGYAGFYTAWQLEKKLRPGEAEVTVVDPRPYMTYQPFLPEVAAGSIGTQSSPSATITSLTRAPTGASTSQVRPSPRSPWSSSSSRAALTSAASTSPGSGRCPSS